MQSKEGGTMMSKQHLYIILDDWDSGFSIRKVDLDIDQLILGGRTARDAAASLSPPCTRFKARQESPVCFSDALGSKILCLQPKEDGKKVPDMGGLFYDVRERSLNYIPRHTRQLRPVYFPIGGKLFALGNCSMELLDLQPLVVSPSASGHQLAWRKLPNAPFDSLYVISHAVITDRKTILVSVDITRTTYSFHIEDFKWERLGDWVLPFDGRGCFIPELDTWVGLSLYGEKPGRICSCKLASATTFEGRPEVKYGKEYLFTEDPAEKHRGSKLVYMGGGHENRFCLVECIEIIEGNKDENMGQDENMVVDPPRGVHMFRLTKFSLKLDENRDLTTGDSRRVRYYKVPNEEINDLLFLWPRTGVLAVNKLPPFCYLGARLRS